MMWRRQDLTQKHGQKLKIASNGAVEQTFGELGSAQDKYVRSKLVMAASSHYSKSDYTQYLFHTSRGDAYISHPNSFPPRVAFHL